VNIAKKIYFVLQLLVSIFSSILRGKGKHPVFHFSVIRNYISLIDNLVKNKKVLNLGCAETSNVFEVNHNEIEQEKYWFHKHLSTHADYVLGVDIDTDRIYDMKSCGFNVERYDLDNDVTMNGEYDVVVAHHVLEHISNNKSFINTIKRCLSKDGTLIIKAFNARSWSYDVSIDMHDLNGTDYLNPDHILIHAPIPLINMLNKNGIYVENGFFICSNKYCSIISLFNKTKADDIILVCKLINQ